jgi:hypothetical protein
MASNNEEIDHVDRVEEGDSEDQEVASLVDGRKTPSMLARASQAVARTFTTPVSPKNKIKDDTMDRILSTLQNMVERVNVLETQKDSPSSPAEASVRSATRSAPPSGMYNMYPEEAQLDPDIPYDVGYSSLAKDRPMNRDYFSNRPQSVLSEKVTWVPRNPGNLAYCINPKTIEFSETASTEDRLKAIEDSIQSMNKSRNVLKVKDLDRAPQLPEKWLGTQNSGATGAQFVKLLDRMEKSGVRFKYGDPPVPYLEKIARMVSTMSTKISHAQYKHIIESCMDRSSKNLLYSLHPRTKDYNASEYMEFIIVTFSDASTKEQCRKNSRIFCLNFVKLRSKC